MKKLIIICLPLVMLAACTKDLTSLNIDPKNPVNVPSQSLFTNAQRTLASTMASPNVNLNIFRLIVQQWTETTYTDESNFDLNTRQIPRGIWNNLYRDVLRDFQEAKRLLTSDVKDVAIQKNQIAITDIMEVYTWYYLVTTFGNIPYSEALNIDKPFPKYDDQKTIFDDLFKRLNADISALTTGTSYGDADIIYGGNIAKWKKFANSLKLKMGMTIADADPAIAKTIIESAVNSGVFTSNSDNAEFAFLSGPPNTNPIWVDLVQSGRKDFVVTSTIVNKTKSLSDPRIPFYFTNDATGDYTGGIPGAGNNYATYSKPAKSITDPDFPGLLLDYSEVEFLLAEAIERGFSVGGTAAVHYNNAVTASILYWGGTQVQAMAYLAQPSVSYATATGTYKQKIGEQKWLALYNRGWDAWIEWRRLDYPQLVMPPTALSVIPLRFTYNVDEQNLNKSNYNAAASAIGGDKVTTKLYWDKF